MSEHLTTIDNEALSRVDLPLGLALAETMHPVDQKHLNGSNPDPDPVTNAEWGTHVPSDGGQDDINRDYSFD